MDTQFHYNVVPKTTGTGVSTRIVLQDELTPAEIYTAAAASTGLTAVQVEAATAAVFTQIITAARSGRRARRVGGLFSFTPRCGGSFPSEDFEPTVENMNLAINAALAPEGDALFHDGISFHRDAVMGQKTPEIIRVYDSTSRLLNFCTPGGPFKISGHDFGPEPAVGNTTCGIFIVNAAGNVRIPAYSEWTPTEIMGAWPVAVPPSFQILVTTCYEGSTTTRTFIWPTDINR
jgi:hypothetical protein